MALAKPEKSEIHALLKSRNALVVHFSGTPKGIGTDLLYPADLQNVIRGRAQGGVSTSTVTPRDPLSGQASLATGFIGVILDLRSADSLAFAHVADCGSWLEDGVRKYLPEKDITLDELTLTIDRRYRYNEWVLRHYTVRGIFAVAPYTVWAQTRPAAGPDIPEEYIQTVLGAKNLPLDEICNMAAEHTVYSFADGKIVKRVDGNWVPAAHADIYQQ